MTQTARAAPKRTETAPCNIPWRDLVAMRTRDSLHELILPPPWLGLSRRSDHVVLHLLSLLMLGANHAVAHGHVMHHRHAMGPGDFEGRCGHMGALEVLLYGPRFPVDLNRGAWAGSGPRGRRRIVIDWGLILITLLGVWLTPYTAPKLHLAAMAVAQCLTAFFAVWITHQGTHHSGLAARSQRGWLARAA